MNPQTLFPTVLINLGGCLDPLCADRSRRTSAWIERRFYKRSGGKITSKERRGVGEGGREEINEACWEK
jgi:hypothetical protein